MQEFKRKKVFFLTWLFLLNFTYFSLMLSSTLEQISFPTTDDAGREKKERKKKWTQSAHFQFYDWHAYNLEPLSVRQAFQQVVANFNLIQNSVFCMDILFI